MTAVSQACASSELLTSPTHNDSTWSQLRRSRLLNSYEMNKREFTMFRTCPTSPGSASPAAQAFLSSPELSSLSPVFALFTLQTWDGHSLTGATSIAKPRYTSCSKSVLDSSLSQGPGPVAELAKSGPCRQPSSLRLSTCLAKRCPHCCRWSLSICQQKIIASGNRKIIYESQATRQKRSAPLRQV